MISQRHNYSLSLSKKVLLSVTGTIVVILSLTTFFYLHRSITQMRWAQQEQVSNLAAAFSASNIEALLIRDYPFLETSAENILLSNSDISWVSIKSLDNTTLVEVNKKDIDIKEEVAIFKQQIIYEGKPLGWLQFGLSTTANKRAIIINVIFILGLGLTTLLIVSIILYIVLRKLVLSPVKQLYEFTKEVQAGCLDIQVNVSSNDELGALATAFNEMTKNLKHLMEKEKEFVAQRVLAEAERKKVDESKSINQQLMANEQRLKVSNQKLMAANERIEKSKRELEKKIFELERFEKVTVGRELEMMKLKKRINGLLEELGQAKQYKNLYVKKEQADF